MNLLRKVHCPDLLYRKSALRFYSDLNRGSNHKSRDLNVRFELLETAIWGKFLRFGLRDFKSLAICDLLFGALMIPDLAWKSQTSSQTLAASLKLGVKISHPQTSEVGRKQSCRL